MFAPILPRPTIPSCIDCSLLDTVCCFPGFVFESRALAFGEPQQNLSFARQSTGCRGLTLEIAATVNGMVSVRCSRPSPGRIFH